MSIRHFFEVYSLRRVMRMIPLRMTKLPMLPGMRGKLLKIGGVNIKGTCWIYPNVKIDSVAPQLIHIGNNVTITEGTKILTHYLDSSVPGRHFRLGKVTICDNVFIGVNVVICNSVTIGEGAIIGAGSIVTKDIPPYQVWAGNPARYIKDRVR